MHRAIRFLTLTVLVASSGLWAAQPAEPSRVLPPPATTKLAASLASAKPVTKHVWRDTPPTNPDGTVNAYIEIARGDRNKWEFDMAKNSRFLDRVIPEKLGTYPVNYGIVPQTVSYDGDPFDALVLGPPIEGGSLVRGAIVGLFLMEDEKGHDAKVVLSLVDPSGKPLHALEPAHQQQMVVFFRPYKEDLPGLFSKVAGWASAEHGRAHVMVTHAFFTKCAMRAGTVCEVR
jgi:inorganic pyrophosphatase